MKRLERSVNNILDSLQGILLAVLIKLGPFAVALMPALFTSYAIYATFRAEAGWHLALLFALTVGLAIETVGIVATHTAIDLYNGQDGGYIQPVKFYLMAALVPVYVAGVSGVVYFSKDAFTPLVRALGVASPALTVVVYIAVALARDLRAIEQKEEQASEQESALELSERQHRHRLELRRLELEAARATKELELNAQVQIERQRAVAQPAPSQHHQASKPAQAGYECDDCGREFGTVQALNAHSRFCQPVSVNGRKESS